MLIDIIAGARPNFIKIAPLIEALEEKIHEGYLFQFRLIHTGQHYDKQMSSLFFEQLGIREPDINLAAGGGTQAEQTANIMTRYEQVILKQRPSLVIVVGDVTSTLACTLAAKKMYNIPVAHVEAGIRSGDWNMPEEINRIVTDALSDYYFTPSLTANYNLLQAGIPSEKIYYVGNTMIDTLLKNQDRLHQPDIWKQKNLCSKGYLVLTMHRHGNVENEIRLHALIHAVSEAAKEVPVIFPVHPHTAKMLEKFHIPSENIIMTEPMGYLEFIYLVKHAKGVITDSGGITEETTVMNVPCITLRDTTERPETCTIGTNELIGTNPAHVAPAMAKLLSGNWKQGKAPRLWDGQTAKRIANILVDALQVGKSLRGNRISA